MIFLHRQKVALMVSTCLGTGYSPVAPGGMASILTTALILLIGRGFWEAPVQYMTILVLFSVVGVWAAGVTSEVEGEPDPQIVVVDELAGTMVALAGAPLSWWSALIGLILFRIFDTWKPGPIRTIDRRVRGGWGVMLDDLAAGLLAAGVLYAIHRIFGS